MSIQSLGTTENKQLLWGILMEEGIFDTIPRNIPIKEVQRVFESTLRILSNNAPPTTALIELNRMAIESLATIIPQIKNEDKNVIITAEDIRNQKRYEIEHKLREKEAESRALLDRPVPPAIDFSDKDTDSVSSASASVSATAHRIRPGTGTGPGPGPGPSRQYRERYDPDIVDITASLTDTMTLPMTLPITLNKPAHTDDNNQSVNAVQSAEYNDEINDSPIGDDMDKLIADRIATRERDLAEITQRIAPRPSDAMKMDAMVMRRTVPVQVQAPAESQSQSQSLSQSQSQFRDDREVQSLSQSLRSTANKVRFSEATFINEEPNTTTEVTTSTADNEMPDVVDNIYLRLKRKQPPPPPQHQPQMRDAENDETIRKIQEMLFEMKREIADISRRQNEMFERFMK